MELRRQHHAHNEGVDDNFDRQKDRKQRRRDERQSQKRARIEAHEKWVEQRRLRKFDAQAERVGKGLRKKAATLHSRPVRINVSSSSTKEKVSASGEKKIRSNVKGDSKKIRGKMMDIQRENSKECKEQKHLEALSNDTTTMEPGSIKYVPPTLRRHAQEESNANVDEVTRRIVNKLTVKNVAQMTRDASEIFGGAVKGATRAIVLRSILQHINRMCMIDVGLLTPVGSLPFAGLIRGLQLLHGNVVGAELVEGICMMLQELLQQGNETGVSNGAMLLGHLYILNAVDTVLVSSFLRNVMRTGSSESVCAVAGALTLLRVCGEKLLKEAPGQMEQVLAEARKCGGEQKESSRYTVLLSFIAEIVAGRTRSAKRVVDEEKVPVESVLRELSTLLPGFGASSNSRSTTSSSVGNKRAALRIMSTSSVLTGMTWTRIVSEDKPPRWYIPEAWEDNAGNRENNNNNNNNDNGADDDDDTDRDGSASEEEGARDSSLARSKGLIVGDDDEIEAKAARIRKLRQEEKAASGQRLNTENKREIFKCIINASDDLEAFTFLMHRDPSFSRLHDTLTVLLQCCYQEKVYNPYYAQIIRRLCSIKVSCQKTLQFALWDLFKAIRTEPVDVIGYLNFACLLTYFIEEGVFTLSVLRGLDLDSTNRTIGLFTRMLLLRLILQLPPEKLTEVFFGGDGFSAHDIGLDTSVLRSNLATIVERYFVDERESEKWIPHFYDVVAVGTPFGTRQRVRCANSDGEESKDEDALLRLFAKRIRVVFKALKHGIS